MQSFTIRDIENLTGIKAHTLRIWEQRYSFFQPKRKESLHRFYDNDDLKQLLRISFLYHQGWKVSRIASLSQEQIAGEVRNARVNSNYSQYVLQLLETALDFDEAGFRHLFDRIKKETGFENSILEVAYPYLLKLGLLWSTNNVIPAQEHFSSYIIQNQIIHETEQLGSANRQPEVLLFCPEGEFHELPLLFMNYLFRKNGRSTLYLGTGINQDELNLFNGLSSIEFIYLHLITNFTGTTVDEYLEGICKTFSNQRVIASGEGLRESQLKCSNLLVLKSDNQVHEFMNEIRYEHSS